MKEMEELFHIQSVKERCLNDLEKARMEMAYIESFRQLPNLRHPHHIPPPSAFSGNHVVLPVSSASSSLLQQQRPRSSNSSSSGSAATVVGQAQAELPRLLQAAATTTTTNGIGESSASSGRIVKPQGVKPSDQDYIPLIGNKQIKNIVCYQTVSHCRNKSSVQQEVYAD
jgi:hypothetical protein